MDKNEISKTIYVLRSIALFGIVTAHGTGVPETFSALSIWIGKIYGAIGSIGVGIFFALSGYLLCKGRSHELSFGQFVIAKVKRLCPAWIVSAILTYLYVALRKDGTIWGGIIFALGYQSFYWYMSVLMILYVVCLS